jgi:hypothetical protein
MGNISNVSINLDKYVERTQIAFYSEEVKIWSFWRKVRVSCCSLASSPQKRISLQLADLTSHSH